MLLLIYFQILILRLVFFHFSQRLWRKVTDLKLNKLVSRSKKNNNSSEEEKQKAHQWFSGAIGLALIPPSFVESIWTDIMDNYSPESP